VSGIGKKQNNGGKGVSENVTIQDALSIRVTKWLIEKGFKPAFAIGIAVDNPSEYQIDALERSIGILWKDPNIQPKKWFFNLLKEKFRHQFLGVICFNDGQNRANEREWVIKTYGRNRLEMVSKLADEMAATFKVRIIVRLVQEVPKLEVFQSELLD
jgi:hypothetical protein